MKLVDKISALPPEKPYYTFEFFPPRTDQGFDNLATRIVRLSKLRPVAVNVTWGAGGSTRHRSLDLAGLTQSKHGIDTIMHLTCTNMEKGLVDESLMNAKKCGIQNILALRGDPPRGEEYWLPTDSRFTHAEDLVSYIRSSPEHGQYFCIGVAGYPDGHPDKLMDSDAELAHLKAKIDAGADFITTQLFYDVDRFLSWVQKVRKTGIHVPIIAGIMPIQNYASFVRLTRLCGCQVPNEILHALDPIKTDDRQVKEFGIALATQMISAIVESSDVRGFHLCTLNLEKSVQTVLENLQWVGRHTDSVNRVISDRTDIVIEPSPASMSDTSLRITAMNAAAAAAGILNEKPAPTSGPGEAGKGELNNAATWDEFPNGRFGDIKSPAYGGGVDLWTSGISKPVKSINKASPKSADDITDILSSWLRSHRGDHPAPSTSIPFTTAPLSAESLTILPQLLKLTRRGWWTVGSQPAVDGALSSDTVVGWGPAGGWVFQKAFCEFFVEEEVVLRLAEHVKRNGQGVVTYFASGNDGDLMTNMGDEGRNAVTWGVFPGHEIEQSTIIERDSFLTWKDEAFDMWTQWALSFPPDSQERACLDDVRQKRWLVSVVHHDFKNSNGLWEFLLSDEL